MSDNYVGRSPSPSAVVSLDALAARVTALEALPLPRRVYVGSVAAGVLTQVRSVGGIAVVRTGSGAYQVTLTPPEPNALYAPMVSMGAVLASGAPSDGWVSYARSSLNVNGFVLQFSIWSTGRVVFDPEGFTIAIL